MSNNTVSVSNAPFAATFTAKDAWLPIVLAAMPLVVAVPVVPAVAVVRPPLPPTPPTLLPVVVAGAVLLVVDVLLLALVAGAVPISPL
ncbi:hypothetical protein CNMCM8980_005710 [Aspergillus fumigatiaffinis]|jgi:hypothetical protein|uniref:Uncharacterized protein n=1 Tax=Aspergillus fumigatiaffinis TaxID=340414 RepID=A0A8H4H923_9EURO|nr:hypothetical protein CNMCM5878_005940 [Aspergillus fumigatiaffinis]KAF4238206.1 hypothetical protein CNMCM6457_010227 [Aspergillus fumigatiaffinis]KAF4243863.1 hypothetical protein CNMCM6805_010374 [Aspergillus fumigatiaffinis]KAF4248552.1 hypothetical protein CNMCM8980_005710 [Aspergillus fumigatiaffinis]